MKNRVGMSLLTVALCMSLGACGQGQASGDDVQQESSVVQVSEEMTQSSETVEESQEVTEEVMAESSAEESTVAEEGSVTEESVESVETENSEGSVAQATDDETVAEEEEEMKDDNNFEVPLKFASFQKGTLYAKMQEITYESKTTGTTRKANLILPYGYTEEKEYPVLYLLHGIGGDHNEWKGGEPVNIISNLVSAGETREMIVVIPNVRARANDAGNPGDIYSKAHYEAFDNFINDLKDDLMPYIEETYSVAAGKENTAIAGLSMGGREALYIGFTMPETFGYIGAFCPAPGILPYTNFGVSEDGLFTEESFTLPEGSDNLVMIVAGKTDGVVGAWPATYHQTLEKNGVEHMFYETEGGHDFGVWKHGLYNFVKRIF